MITSETVRAYFQDEHAWMYAMLRGCFPALTAHRVEDGLEEAVQNTVALAFENVLRCATNGKILDEHDLTRYVKSSLWWAVQHTRARRSITHKPNADKKFGDVYERMKPRNASDLGDFIGRSTPVPDAVSFRVDIPAFFATLTERERGMATELMSGMATKEVAEMHGVTPSAISQFRTKFYRLWRDYFDEV